MTSRRKDGLCAPGFAELVAADPFRARTHLPHRILLYPQGFPVEIHSNSELVIQASMESWGGYPRRFDTAPLQVRMAIDEQQTGGLPGYPVFRNQGSLMSIISDAANFAVCELKQGTSFSWLTPAVAECPDFLRYHFLESIVYATLAYLRLTPIHAGCVARNGRGVLLSGESGAGKSSLTFACALRGWVFVSDDGSSLVRGSKERKVLGRPHQFRFRQSAADLFPSLEGRLAAPHPNGKISLEVRTAELPEVATAFESSVDAVVFLARNVSDSPQLVPVSPEDAFERLVLGMNAWEDDVMREHDECLRNLLTVDCYELRYRSLEEGVRCLDSIIDRKAES